MEATLDLDERVKAFERFAQVKELVRNDEDANGMLNSLIESALRYVTNVTYFVASMQTLRGDSENIKFVDPDEYRNKLQNMENTRRRSHESLISNLNAFNRYLRNNYSNAPEGGIFSLEPSMVVSRGAVADWAGHFVFGIKQLDGSK